jgi:hypothetical protein
MTDAWFGADANVPPKHGRTEMRERGKTARPQAVVAQARENMIATQRERIDLLTREIRQCATELEEAANVMRPNLPALASIYAAAAERARIIIREG